MGVEDDKNIAVVVDHQHHHHHHDQQSPPPPGPPQPHYGTFQGVANYPPPQPPAMEFPLPVPPPGASGQPPSYYHHHQSPYYPEGYQTVPGYAVGEDRPGTEGRLPCCGLGLGWCLFILGFFFGAIPWYLGLFMLMFARIDHREKPGYIACTIAAVLAAIAIVLGVR